MDLSRRVRGRVGKSQYHRAAGYSFQCDGPGVAVGVFAVDRDQPSPAPVFSAGCSPDQGLRRMRGGGQLQGAIGQWAEIADQSCTVFQFEFWRNAQRVALRVRALTSARWIILGRLGVTRITSLADCGCRYTPISVTKQTVQASGSPLLISPDARRWRRPGRRVFAPAVHGKTGAADIGRQWRCEKQAGIADIRWQAHAPQRNGGGHCGHSASSP